MVWPCRLPLRHQLPVRGWLYLLAPSPVAPWSAGLGPDSDATRVKKAGHDVHADADIVGLSDCVVLEGLWRARSVVLSNCIVGLGIV